MLPTSFTAIKCFSPEKYTDDSKVLFRKLGHLVLQILFCKSQIVWYGVINRFNNTPMGLSIPNGGKKYKNKK